MALTKSTIAVVDDDPSVLESLENLLESYGYAVRCYASAVAFLADDVLCDIDCIISDVGMPLVDGFELQRRIEIERPRLPIILITARHDVSPYEVASTSLHGFFRKPVMSDRLLNCVASAISNRR